MEVPLTLIGSRGSWMTPGTRRRKGIWVLQEEQEGGRATGSAEETGEVVPHRCPGAWSVLPGDSAQAGP